MSTPKKLRLVAYLRVSSSAQQESDTIELQRTSITKWAKANGHRIVTWCEDSAVSGSLGVEQRPGLACALDAIDSGTAHGVVFTKLDRLARELTIQEGTLASLWARESVKVFACEEGGEILADDPSDPMRTAMRQMAGVFAQLERGQIRLRLDQGRRAKAAKGGYVGGAPPYGRRARGQKLIPDPHEAPILERAKELHDDGASIRSICATFNDEGVPSKRGGKWHPTTVARLLAS